MILSTIFLFIHNNERATRFEQIFNKLKYKKSIIIRLLARFFSSLKKIIVLNNMYMNLRLLSYTLKYSHKYFLR